MNDHPKPTTETEVVKVITKLMHSYLLGVIVHVNDILQDVHGRKGLAEKKQVLRGLGALLVMMGPSAGTVSPQVGQVANPSHRENAHSAHILGHDNPAEHG